MQEQSTAQCWQHPVLLQQNKQDRWSQQWEIQNSFWIEQLQATKCWSNTKQHCISSSQQCLILKWDTGIKQGRGAFFHIKQNNISGQQWHNPQHSASHQSSDIIHKGSRVRHVIHQCKICGPRKENTHGNGTPTATDANTNRQFDCIWYHHQQNNPHGHQSQAYVLPLVMWKRTATATIIKEKEECKICVKTWPAVRVCWNPQKLHPQQGAKVRQAQRKSRKANPQLQERDR